MERTIIDFTELTLIIILFIFIIIVSKKVRRIDIRF